MEQNVGNTIPGNQGEHPIRREEIWYDDRGMGVPHQQEMQAPYCKYQSNMAALPVANFANMPIAAQWWRDTSTVSTDTLCQDEGPSGVLPFSSIDNNVDPQSSIVLQSTDEFMKKGIKSKVSKKVKSTKETKDSIKRAKHPEKWKVNIKKSARLKGEEYIGVGGKLVPAKVMGPPCDCRMRCNDKIEEVAREQLHSVFWKTCTWEQRKQYIALLVKESPKQRTRCRSDVKSENRSTFSVSEKFVRHAMDKKRTSPGGIIGPDQRGRHTPKSKKSEVVRDRVREHIKSFPTEKASDSKYQSGQRFLESGLSIAAMHKLYVNKCKAEGVPDNEIVKESYYREMFKAEFNLAFRPLKTKKSFDDKKEEFT